MTTSTFIRALVVMPATFMGEAPVLRWVRVEPTGHGHEPATLELYRYDRHERAPLRPNPQHHKRARSARWWRREGVRRAALNLVRLHARRLVQTDQGERLVVYAEPGDPRDLPDDGIDVLIAHAERLFPLSYEEGAQLVADAWPGSDPGNVALRAALHKVAAGGDLGLLLVELRASLGLTVEQSLDIKAEVRRQIEVARRLLDRTNPRT